MISNIHERSKTIQLSKTGSFLHTKKNFRIQFGSIKENEYITVLFPPSEFKTITVAIPDIVGKALERFDSVVKDKAMLLEKDKSVEWKPLVVQDKEEGKLSLKLSKETKCFCWKEGEFEESGKPMLKEGDLEALERNSRVILKTELGYIWKYNQRRGVTLRVTQLVIVEGNEEKEEEEEDEWL